MRRPYPVAPTQVKRTSSGGFSQDDDIPIIITERRRKSRPRLSVDDDEENDGAQADEEHLAGIEGAHRRGPGEVDTGMTRRRSFVVSSASLIMTRIVE